MTEFFNSCWTWFLENKDSIVIFLTSTQFVSLVTVIFNLVKSNKAVGQSTMSSNKLNESLNTTNKIAPIAEDVKTNTELLIKSQESQAEVLKEMNNKLNETLNLQTEKINAIIEVQSIVYSTIKDEKVRNTVNNLLIKAKYAETATRAELEKQVEELKAAVAEQDKALNETVEKTANNVKTVVNTGVTPEKSKEIEEFVRG